MSVKSFTQQEKANHLYVIISNHGKCPQVGSDELGKMCPLYDTSYCNTTDFAFRVAGASDWLNLNGFTNGDEK